MNNSCLQELSVVVVGLVVCCQLVCQLVVLSSSSEDEGRTEDLTGLKTNLLKIARSINAVYTVNDRCLLCVIYDDFLIPPGFAKGIF